MRKLRMSHKGTKPIRKEMSINARDIILSIFSTETDAQKLQYNKSDWQTTNTGKKSSVFDSSTKMSSQPLKYLYPFIQHISKGVDIESCSFMFVDGNILRIANKDKRWSISKAQFTCSKVKYWLSHIYFSRYRSKFSQKLLASPKSTARDIINIYEEKQYMPKMLMGKPCQKAPFIRKLIVSPEGRYRRNNQTQKESFCIVYNKNGSQQQFSFSQILSFVDYPFNLRDIVYVKILHKNLKNNLPISLRYSKLNESKYEYQQLMKYRSIYLKQNGWQVIQQQQYQKKQTLLNQQNFDQYCGQLVLDIIAFIQVNQGIAVNVLEMQWGFSTNNKNFILTNVSKYTTVQTQVQNTAIGLETLYKKLRSETPRQKSRHSKRVKSEEKDKTALGLFALALQTVQKDNQPSSRLDSPSSPAFRINKGKSANFKGLTLSFT